MSSPVNDEQSQLLYVWGAWVWYYRALALIVYATGSFVVLMLLAVIQDYQREPGAGTFILIPLVLLLAAMWLLWAWVTWRNGQQKVSRLELLPDGQTLRARTLNFGTRYIALTDVTNVEYNTYEQHTSVNGIGSNQYYLPHVTVDVRNAQPLYIDAQGQIRDPEKFKTILRYDPDKRRVTRPKKRRGRDVPR